jgi:uncharacterized OsmC-like protein
MPANLDYEVVVSAGSLRPQVHDGVVMPHARSNEGVVIETEFTGGHLYHLAVAGCLLNDVYREGERMGIRVDGARVRASGEFDPMTWSSKGIAYEIEVASDADDDEIEHLLLVVDDVAEIPRVLRTGTTVARARHRRSGPTV